jgi:hypothetical protein
MPDSTAKPCNLIHSKQTGTIMPIRLPIASSMIFVSLSTFVEPAFAYLDPGTGGMLIQIILGGVAGLAVAGKLFWHQLKSFFGFGSSEKPDNPSDET